MDFQLTEEQTAFQESAKQFAIEQLAPHAMQWDQENFFPVETLKQAAELGFASLSVAEEHGGCGLSRLDGALIFEQLAWGCISTSAYLSIHNMVLWVLDTYASSDIKEKFLSQLITFKSFSSYCLTEPDSGSDAQAMKTKADLQGDDYILNGSKMFISGAPVSDVYLVMARTSEEKKNAISAFVVNKESKGIKFGEQEKKMGWHSQPTAMVYFEDCSVPAKQLIGEKGKGFNIALAALDRGRINIAACSLGGAQYCIDKTIQYMQDRKQFNQSLSAFQALQFKMADLTIELEAARQLVYKAAWMLDNKHPSASPFCAMAKKKATEVGFQVANECMQLHGGYGYLVDYEIERCFRDLRVHPILEGTNEIMRLIIARKLFSEQGLK